MWTGVGFRGSHVAELVSYPIVINKFFFLQFTHQVTGKMKMSKLEIVLLARTTWQNLLPLPSSQPQHPFNPIPFHPSLSLSLSLAKIRFLSLDFDLDRFQVPRFLQFFLSISLFESQVAFPTSLYLHIKDHTQTYIKSRFWKRREINMNCSRSSHIPNFRCQILSSVLVDLIVQFLINMDDHMNLCVAKYLFFSIRP